MKGRSSPPQRRYRSPPSHTRLRVTVFSGAPQVLSGSGLDPAGFKAQVGFTLLRITPN